MKNMKIFLQNNIITDESMSNDEVFAYVAIRKAMSQLIPIIDSENADKKMYISAEQLCFALTGDIIDAYLDMLINGINGLLKRRLITSDGDSQSQYGYIIDVSQIYFNTKEIYFTIVEEWEIKKILTWSKIKYVSKRVSLMRYFIVLISTFNHSKDALYGGGKIGHMSIKYIADKAKTSDKSAKRYNKDLEEMQLLYVYRTNDKYLIDGHFKQIKNTYSRYADKEICNAFAYENESQGYIHNVVIPIKNKEKADYNRSLGAKYRALVKWYVNGEAYKYDDYTIHNVYWYIKNKNAKLEELIAKKHDVSGGKLSDNDLEYINKLKKQIRDISFLDDYEHLYWGEPNKMDDITFAS